MAGSIRLVDGSVDGVFYPRLLAEAIPRYNHQTDETRKSLLNPYEGQTPESL